MRRPLPEAKMGAIFPVTLEQQGSPLNYFVYPYAELDGKPLSGLQTHFSFKDTPAGGTAAAK